MAFEAGMQGVVAARTVAAMCFAYALATGLHASRGLRAGLEDRWSAATCAAVMAALGIAVWVLGPQALPSPFGPAAALAFVAGAVFTLTYTLSRFEARIQRFREAFGERLVPILERLVPEERLRAWQDIKAKARLDGHEERRKGVHLLMGFFLAIYAAAGYGIVWLAARHAPPATEWGANLLAAEAMGWLACGHLVGLTALFLVLGVIAPTELLRLRYPELSYPFKAVILSRLRRREAGLFGAHYYISAAMPLAVLVLCAQPERWPVTVPGVFAVFGVTVFADAASALVGVRWGRTKWFHNAGKSYAGTVAGTLVAFGAALPFVGAPVALAAAGAFVLVDVIAPVPIPVSDNLLNPTVTGAVMMLAAGHMDGWVAWY